VVDHYRVDVRVHDPGGRVDLLRDLVHVLVRGQSRADVKELGDALAGEEPHGPPEEVAVLPGEPGQRREGRGLALGGFPVGRELSLPPSQ
jgi:hypothetical protein